MGLKIKMLRQQKNINQAELGKIVGVGKTTISNYETGYSVPDLETLIKLADYFGVTTDYLLGRSDKPQQNENLISQPISNKHISSNEEELLRIFRKLQTEAYQDKAISQFVGYVDCLAQLEEANTGNLGKVAQSTPSKKNVG